MQQSLVNAVSKEEYNSSFKTADDWVEWPDKPHVNISISKSIPSSITSTSNPLRKFKWLDLCRLYTTDNSFLPLTNCTGFDDSFVNDLPMETH